jgi:AcrR family transcriptional regulator
MDTVMDQLSLRERHRQRVTQQIITAAESLFKARGFSHTTMEEIADKAEISRATLFNYFPSKEDLLLPWGREILEQEIRPRLAALLDTRPTTAHVLHALLTDMSESVQVCPDVVRAFTREASKSLSMGSTGDAVVGMREILTRVLSYGQERGEVRSDIPVDRLARYLITLQGLLLIELLEQNPSQDAPQEISRLLAFVQGGLAPKQ